MKVYELVCAGFTGGDDKTDHLVNWVVSPDLETLTELLKDYKVTIEEIFQDWRAKFGENYYEYIFGVDFYIPEQSEQLLDHLTLHKI